MPNLKEKPSKAEYAKAKKESLKHIRKTIEQYGVESNIPHNDDYWRELDLYRAMTGVDYEDA